MRRILRLSQPLSAPAVAFGFTVAVALGYALYTGHTWEDYYITYRSSKHLATGQGLVFNVGDRLHTFTSPLGVLLPALASLLTGNTSDPAALWIFRAMCLAALGGAAALVVRLFRALGHGGLAAGATVAFVALDAKTVDFTINGMETAFMLLFLAYALWAQAGRAPRAWLHLGAAWAGLMWTRPDSFIYIGLLAAGLWLFNDPARSGANRWQLLGTYLRAGAITTALYLPWLLFAHGYYGTAVPHTITAKSGLVGPHTPVGVLLTALQLPLRGWSDLASLQGTFLPAYYMIGGWPEWLVLAGGVLATTCALLWLVPGLRGETRACSFACFGGHVYLSYFPYFPFPWYLPAPAFLGLLALGGLLGQALAGAAPGRIRPRAGLVLAGLLVLGGGWTTWQTARQFRAQQEIIEEGNRRRIGEWLREHAAPGDTVFLEPLGYIGFYSGLRTHDFPGMSSREMVRARGLVGNDWLPLIEHLQPTWLVLRRHEAVRLGARSPALFDDHYAPAAEFSVADRIRALDVRGRLYLEHDADFGVYRLRRPIMKQTPIAEATSRFDVAYRHVEGRELTMVHAPGTMTVKVPTVARRFAITYGFPPDAYTGPGPWTDGATFQIDWEADGRVVSLLNVHVDPVANPAHRALQHLEVALPPTRDPGARLVLRTLAGLTTTKDWTCWGAPTFDHVQ